MHKIVIYTKDQCKQSEKVRQLLNNNKLAFQERNITHDVLLKREMIERTGGRATSPQIFIDNNLLSSLKELEEIIRSITSEVAA